MIKSFVGIVFMLLLASCASVPSKVDEVFKLDGRVYLQEIRYWGLSGRVSVIDKKNAASATLQWQHQDKKDRIKLSGLFGLGRTEINLAEQVVEIKSAGKRETYSGNIDDVVASELGIAIPISSLKYWVLGVPDPMMTYKKIAEGFVQQDWRVSYLQMQNDEGYAMPRKIRVEQGEAKLKLIINQWELKHH